MARLKEIRKARGLKQRELAQAAGVSLSAIRKYEQGTQDVGTASYYTVASLADALDVDASQIVEVGHETV